jgi:hypothetical protein
MSVKAWLMDHLHGFVGRPDLASREPTLKLDDPPRSGTGEPSLVNAPHLGAYATLMAALRDELEHFVASQVRLHLAIADRDRFLLTAIGVRCRGSGGSDGAARRLLSEFLREFKPEQVKRYLAREVIGALPNASAIDLSQFAGLMDADAQDGAADDDGHQYRELIEALRVVPPEPNARPFEVNLLGRWVEGDVAATARLADAAPARPGAVPVTPLAGGQRCLFDLEDADGRRIVVLPSVVSGRRYIVGKGEGCDIRVNATYASRRHAELWLDDGRWWVADAGSTNGLRVETAARQALGAANPASSAARAASGDAALAFPAGARLVLSARTEGPSTDYPWLALRSAAAAAGLTPIASAAVTADEVPKTPLTSVMVKRPGADAWTLRVAQAGGVRTLVFDAQALPARVGRSRNQSLVIDRQHEAVSGHHIDITAIDDDGVAQLNVHGDNGVLLDGVHHGPGSRLRWRADQVLVLGASTQGAPQCRLVRGADDEADAR